MIVNVFGQWTGNALVGLLLSAVLDTAGIKDQVSQTNLKLGLSFLQLLTATTGSFLVDLIGRRPLLMFSNIALASIWVCMAVATSQHEKSGSADSARAIVAFIVLFDIVFAACVTPLQVLYTVEVLPFETRAKGDAFGGLAVNIAGLVNQFAWPISLAAIGWKTYIILVLWCLFQAIVIYLVLPETRNCTVSPSMNLYNVFQLIFFAA
jgi:MFS family permease